MKVKFAARSDVGHVRQNNEDNLFCNGESMTVSTRERPFFLTGLSEVPCVFAVCDGMGGEAKGELASLTAVETLGAHAEAIRQGSHDEVQAYVHEANSRILGIMKSERIIMGTTLALAVVKEGSFTAYNLGDSRMFRTHKGRVVRITDDHTLAEDKVRMGLMTPQKAEESRERHCLTRYLGIPDDEVTNAPDINGPYDFGAGDRVILCSDGLTEMLKHQEINAIVTAREDISEAVNALVDAALMKGGKDNVTCIILEGAD